MIPSVGRIVHIRLSAECARSINERRHDAYHSGIVSTSQGNDARENDIYPLLITKIWSGEPKESTAVNGQIFLDGNDSFWATSVQQGDGPGKWFEPPIVRKDRD
jgi:hypothetical protein